MAQIRAMEWSRYVGQMVRVYRNLNNGRISVQAYAEGDWRVVAHVQDIVLEHPVSLVKGGSTVGVWGGCCCVVCAEVRVVEQLTEGVKGVAHQWQRGTLDLSISRC